MQKFMQGRQEGHDVKWKRESPAFRNIKMS